jgi:hypothetical protein
LPQGYAGNDGAKTIIEGIRAYGKDITGRGQQFSVYRIIKKNICHKVEEVEEVKRKEGREKEGRMENGEKSAWHQIWL